MKLVSCLHQGGASFVGAVVADQIIHLALLAEYHGEELPYDMLDFINQAPASQRLAEDLLAKKNYPAGTAFSLSNLDLLAPIPRPRKNIFGIGLNYAKHVAESSTSLDTSAELPKEPVIFSKPPTCVIGTGAAIEHNSNVTQQLDWEVELAVIIGARAKRVSREDALKHVFGYSIVIDISARDCRRAGQWIVSKGQDTFAPMGPVLITADEIPDPQNLNLWLKKNGEIKQQDNTSNMLFKVDHLIQDLSSVMTLDPGDIIATGTPDGVGAGRSPQEWLWPGDYLEAGIEGIGTLFHPIVNVTNKPPVL